MIRSSMVNSFDGNHRLQNQVHVCNIPSELPSVNNEDNTAGSDMLFTSILVNMKVGSPVGAS